MESMTERQLLKATKLQYKGKNRQKQLDQLTHEVAKLADPVWTKLSTEAQKWYNAAADAIANKQEIPDFSAAGGSSKAAAPKKLEKTMAKRKGAKTAVKAAKAVPGNGKAARGERAVKATGAKKASGRTPHGSGATALIHSALVKDPRQTTTELIKGLRTKGNHANRTTISTLKSRTLDYAKRLYEAGHLKDPYAKKVAELIAAS